MTQSHRRSPSSSHYLSKPKSSSRPILHRRGTSGANLSISKLGSGHHHSHSNSFSISAMCEKQITVPNNTLLYCSEGLLQTSLRINALNVNNDLYNNNNNNNNNTSILSPSLPRTIVAPMTPTRVQSNPPSARISRKPSHSTSSDLDPTEWKPVITSTPTSIPLASSEAWNYLSQFHGPDQPLLTRRSTSRSTTSLPGLAGSTPSLSSSISSSASASEYLGSYEHRPLPPRHNPSFSGAAKGVQLVVPHLSSVPGVVVEMVDNIPVSDSDAGSIFPASSSVWEDEVSKPISISRSAART
ncbi:hypothetical protein N7450_003899 [Penicillium hetheringtonii]|uniref:Uncharacterized protein n=1 Tax=Penicillium hetheringtonii TaxID=911720 RepID=A0AAD6DP07_9EURO|nr:hypothetical protein N7450_003899 [Penicillium hetheringtonii]